MSCRYSGIYVLLQVYKSNLCDIFTQTYIHILDRYSLNFIVCLKLILRWILSDKNRIEQRKFTLS